LNITFRLKPGRDDTIIDWVNCLGSKDRSYHIREAMKFYINYGGSNHNSILPQTSSSKARNRDLTNIQTEVPEAKEEVKPVNDIDLDDVLDGWDDSV
jgi:hypothetical protein